MEKSRKGVASIDELGTRSPSASSYNAITCRVPKSNLVHTRGLKAKELALEAHDLEHFEGAWLNAIRATRSRRLRAVVDVFDLVAPSCKT